jgi:hypothetical protein
MTQLTKSITLSSEMDDKTLKHASMSNWRLSIYLFVYLTSKFVLISLPSKSPKHSLLYL